MTNSCATRPGSAKWRRRESVSIRESRSNQSLQQNSLLTGKLTGNSHICPSFWQHWRSLNQQLQWFAAKFPAQENREFFRANREIKSTTREYMKDQPAHRCARQ